MVEASAAVRLGAPLTPGWLARHEINEIASDIAAFLVALHRVPLEAIEELGLPRADGNGDSFAALRRQVLPFLRDVLTPTEYRIVSRWSEEFLSDPTLEHFGAVLRHGDLWFGNVLVDEASGSVVAVLDWTNAAIGDPAKDLARQLHLGQRSPRRCFRPTRLEVETPIRRSGIE